ncbi:MAG: DNA recombination protein RmuC, partial [Bdellovibrionales bacterium]
MNTILTEFAAYDSLLPGVLGFLLGALAASLIFTVTRQRLIARNAELNAQLREREIAFDKAGAALDHRFKATAQAALQQSSEQFLQLAQEKLKAAQSDGAHDLEKRQRAIADLVDPVNKALKTMDEKIAHLETARTKAYAELETHLKSMTADQTKLRQETATLVQALRSPSTRGQWGEMQLKRCLEMAGMTEGVHYEQQVS